MSKYFFIIFLIFPLWIFANTPQLLPRTIIAVYKPTPVEPDISSSNIHVFAEMPLNYLGIKLEYVDIDKPLPDLSKRNDIVGILSWFDEGVTTKNLPVYLQWLSKNIDNGKKIVIIGNPLFYAGSIGDSIFNETLANAIFEKLGIKDSGLVTKDTYEYDFDKVSHEFCNFERAYPLINPQSEIINSIEKNDSEIYLSIQNKDNPTEKPIVLVSINKNGGYIASDYAVNMNAETKEHPEELQWYIDPFLFFNKAFELDNLPRPDVTTIAGRRIFFSHIDGDGWYNITNIPGYKNKLIYSSEIVLDMVIKKFPNLPVTVAPIIAEMIASYAGNKKGIEIARELFALPQVEVASHTYTHPFYWEFFKHYNRQEELALDKNKDPMSSFFKFGDFKKKKNILTEHGYTEFRAYDKYSFDLKQEIYGAFSVLKPLMPENKKVTAIFWSGDTNPWSEVIKMSREAGLYNINGGDSRYDNAYPSYCWVAPIGINVGNQIQIYARSSNEDLYTDLWRKNYFAYKYYMQTMHNTETPIRVLPIDMYYHMYIGEYQSSINALKECLEYAENQNIAPITTSNYCSIADGFYSAKIFKIGNNSWKIENREGLQTIRFDNALYETVDYNNSIGVIGQVHLHGSLYVYLDTTVKEPIIALNDTDVYWKEPSFDLPYLIESRWLIWDLKRSTDSFSFKSSGFGKIEMKWSVPVNGKYEIAIGKDLKIECIAKDNRLKFEYTLENSSDKVENFNISLKSKNNFPI